MTPGDNFSRISAKNLGALALPEYCPRCFWLQAKMGFKLPFQIFPGIFSSIDAYSKTITHLHYHHTGNLPSWMESAGIHGEPIDGLHHSRFQSIEMDYGILMTGVPDEIICNGDELTIIDYKTAKHSKGQDALLPMYRIQLNCYARIAERLGMGGVTRLVLLYYEPKTDISIADLKAVMDETGLLMMFSPVAVPIPLEPESIPPLLGKAKELFEVTSPPKSKTRCRNCAMVEGMVDMLQSPNDHQDH